MLRDMESLAQDAKLMLRTAPVDAGAFRRCMLVTRALCIANCCGR